MKPEGTGTYKNPDYTKGHHVFQGAAFSGAPGYDYDGAYTIGDTFMRDNNIYHGAASGSQSRQQAALRNSGQPNTMEAQATIAYNALITAGASNEVAKNTVFYAQVDMYAHGVTKPSRIPGGRK